MVKKHHQEFHIDDLPCEIQVHIFLRLPVESLIRVKCACKLWYTMISDPKFVELQFNHAVKNPGHLYRFYDLEPNIYYAEKVSNSIEAMKISPEFLRQRLQEGCLWHWLSAGGLMAYSSANERCFFICNPIIQEKIKVPMGPCFGENFHRKCWEFGYSLSTKEYKIVVFVGSPLFHGAIYTLGSETWRDIPHLPFFPMSCDRHIDCDGTLFWLINHDESDGCPETIGSFDIGTEEFRVWRGPYNEMHQEMRRRHRGGVSLCLVKLGDTVACVRRRYFNFICNYSIWTLRDKVNEVWIKEYNFAPSNPLTKKVVLIGQWMNLDLLAYASRDKPRFSKPKYGRTRCVTYDTNSGEFKDLSLPFSEKSDGSTRQLVGLFLSHVGSLISPSQIVAMAKKSSSGDKPLMDI